jgi:putative DNA primase/helicase
MRAREIAMKLGGDGTLRSGRYWANCPVHGGTNLKLSIKDVSHGDKIDVKCWTALCDYRDVKRSLRRLGLLEQRTGEAVDADPKAEAARRDKEAARLRKEQQAKREWARVLWRRAEPNAAEVARYLSEGRGIDLDRIGGVPVSLRYQIDALIPETEPKQYGFAMVAAVTDALDDLTAIHETFLSFSGSAKAGLGDDKYIIGAPKGGAVRLFDVAQQLGISEGIETALSAAELTGIPTWAALNTSCMVGFMVPPSVTSVVIFADRDPLTANGIRPGTVAAEDFAARLRQQRIECRIQYPALGYGDFNDELMARKRKGRAA